MVNTERYESLKAELRAKREEYDAERRKHATGNVDPARAARLVQEIHRLEREVEPLFRKLYRERQKAEAQSPAIPDAPGVYLIHFENEFGHAKHYLGAAGRSIRTRVGMHFSGTGANLTKRVLDSGIEMKVSRVWPTATHEEAFDLEKKLKQQGGRSRMCPFCGVHVREGGKQ